MLSFFRISLFTLLLVLPVSATSNDVDKNRPVAKVVGILKDMMKTLEAEAKEDEEVYDKMACFCQTNDREKSKAITEAETAVERLESEIQELGAVTATLTTEIAGLESEIAKNKDSLNKATSLRKNQLAEFTEEEKDMLESISALNSAIVVLSKHHGSGSFLQLSTNSMSEAASRLERVMTKHVSMLEESFTRKEREQVKKAFAQPYTPQSGAIFGILKNMKETFESNLGASGKDEAENQKVFEELKSTKQAEISAGSEAQATKETQNAEANTNKVNAKQELKDTQESLSADQQFLRELKERCAATDAEWEERSKTRQMEIEACSKALAILSGDDAHDLFTRTFNAAASFVQKQSSVVSKKQIKALRVLRAFAKENHLPEIAMLANQVSLDAFTKVKKAIDDMISALGAEKADEIKHRDFCMKEFDTNEDETTQSQRAKAKAEASIENEQGKIAKETKLIETLTAELEENHLSIKRAGEDRELANTEFQKIIADQQETQRVLKQAVAVLESFYKKNAFVQVSKDSPEMPGGFKEYKNQGGNGVVDMLNEIHRDAKNAEEQATRDEEKSQKAYEDLVIDTNMVIEGKKEEKLSATARKADAEQELVAQEKNRDARILELEHLANFKLQLHTSCDFVLKNFDVRQEARDQEVQALRQAKDILSGADFSK